MSFNSSGFQGVFYFQILYQRLKKLQAKVLNSTCRAEVFQFVNYCKLWTLTVCKLWLFDIFDSCSLIQPIRLFEPFYQRCWLAHCSVFYESIEHANYTFVHFENKIVLKIGELIKRILYYKTNRDIECFSPFFEYCSCFLSALKQNWAQPRLWIG